MTTRLAHFTQRARELVGERFNALMGLLFDPEVLSLGLSPRQFLKIIRSGSGPYSHIKRTGGIALEDGGIWEGGEARSEV